MLRLLTDATTDSTGSSMTEPAAKQLNAALNQIKK